jgi:pyruvate dehydrogenase E2 component (dihydrolipoamide acetyltransferase)
VSALRALTVPKWGMSMEEGEILEWHVKPGDKLSPGDQLVDIETSKIVNTAESPAAGTLVRIVGEIGQTLQVGQIIGVLAGGDASVAEIDAFIAAFVPDAYAAARAQSPSAAEPAPAAPAEAPTPVAPALQAAPDSDLSMGPDDSQVKSSPVARRLARQYNINLYNVPASGRHGRVSKWDVEAVLGIHILPAENLPAAAATQSSQSAACASKDDSHIAVTPVARRLAKRMSINLNDVTANGRHGRVNKADVERAALALTGATDFREEKLSGMRKTIAARLSESKQTIPHFRVSVDIEIDNLLQQRKHMNEILGHQLSVNDFVLKACASALVQVPEVNVQFTGDSLRFLQQVDISMAVAVKGGLITPVIRDMANKGLLQISAEARGLANRAQNGGLTVDEFQGGTFSVSNLGMYGVDEFDAIINLPQAAILAVAAGKKKPVVRGESLAVATVMRVSLSSDHRAIDGAVAAQFVQALKGYLENPASMLL